MLKILHGNKDSKVPVLHLYRCSTLKTVALKRSIFKRDISLGLNYCSMGLSWLPSRGTAPLTLNTIMLLCSLRNFAMLINSTKYTIWQKLQKLYTRGLSLAAGSNLD
jgi:hypothetical protein